MTIEFFLRDDGAPLLRDAAVMINPSPAPAVDPNPVEKAPAQASASDVVRRRDAVVDAARTLDDLTPDGVREFVTKRWQGRKVLQEADVEAFATDARKQRVEDVIDALDHRVRRGTYVRSKVVHVNFPRGMVRQTLRNLTPEEASIVVQRLRGRGWSDSELKRHLKTFSSEIDKSVKASEDDVIEPFEDPIPETPEPVPAAEGEVEFEIKRDAAGRVSGVVRRPVC